ncbi:MAG: SGNH/GDSL hydrolase family protein [Lachnospiraceae bacterium]|nr:SGNH/GDSL hydrolase family protein [Lachnospiraceae bacterium]MDE6699166.1 SGNH/GDSL hydrolase family protein [Lachnospiraceae bacterium]
MTTRKKKVIILAVVLAVMILVLGLLQNLLMPKYMSGIYEGAMIAEYYDDSKNHNILFVGDCEIYENISPVTLWEEYGLTSYMRGSAQQLIWQSYYLLEEMLGYEKPDVVVFNVLSMKYGVPQDEAYNRMTLDGMRLSASKLKSINASMMEDESFLSYIFPILRYHSRWSELGEEDFKYFFSKDKVTFSGYLMRADIKPFTSLPTMPILGDYTFSENSYKYLDMMVELCKENDIELVLMKAPSLYPFWYDEWDEAMVKYADEHDLMYINFLNNTEEIGIDYDTDTYDAGLHLNVYGAEKLAKYFGQILVDNFEFTDYKSDDEVQKHWEELSDDYYAEKQKQKELFEEYGYLKGY